METPLIKEYPIIKEAAVTAVGVLLAVCGAYIKDIKDRLVQCERNDKVYGETLARIDQGVQDIRSHCVHCKE